MFLRKWWRTKLARFLVIDTARMLLNNTYYNKWNTLYPLFFGGTALELKRFVLSFDICTLYKVLSNLGVMDITSNNITLVRGEFLEYLYLEARKSCAALDDLLPYSPLFTGSR